MMDSICWTWVTILTITSILAHESHDKTHECIHDNINHKMTQQYIQYTNHPLESPNQNTRKLLSQQYSPIRIRPYYDPLLINTHILPIDKITYIKSLISTSIHYLEQFVKVIPIAEPLLINRCQRIWHYNSFTYNVCPFEDYTEPLKCQYATIPDSHIAESWYYDPLTYQSYKYKDAGTGIADADLIIYVTYVTDQCSKDGKTLAWASICNLDQYGRPIAGTINFCPQALDNNYWKFDVGVTLHEIMHILVMSNSLFPYFYNTQTGTFYGQDNVIYDGITKANLQNQYIITNKVKQISQTHFGCDTLMGAPLENTGDIGTIGSHWEGKYFHTELMCSTMYSAVLYLSDFTLALLNDCGWYGIDYEYSELFTWGRNEGCNFFQTDCVNKYNSNSNFEQYWCSSSADNGCSYDYTTVSSCLNQVTGTEIIPNEFRWYTDNTFGGPQSHDFCAFRAPKQNNIYKNYEQTCWDTRGNIYNKNNEYPSVRFGIDSRCVEINDNGMKTGLCFQHECIGWDYYYKQYNGVKLLISDGLIDNYEIVTCLKSQSLQYIQSTVYSFTIKCPNIDSLCGHTTEPFQCFWGQYSDVLNKCICSVGYIGNDCSVMDINRFSKEALTATRTYVSSPQFGTGICISNSSKAIINGYYHMNGPFEGLQSYKYINSNGINDIRYLYYLRYLSQWSIANSPGDLSVFAYCTDSLLMNRIIDIEHCKLWRIWDDIKGWIYDVNINVKHCTPTIAPTIQPSFMPTNIPTYNATIITKNPTNNPSILPTNNPSNIPTDFPTNIPTHIPSYTHSPSTIPTYNPTNKPTNMPTNIPTDFPTNIPTTIPTYLPTKTPTKTPTNYPTITPTLKPTQAPITPGDPTRIPTYFTKNPTVTPTNNPTKKPTNTPTNSPTISPTFSPTKQPTRSPTERPTISPTNTPTMAPVAGPTKNPTLKPTNSPITPTDGISSNLNPPDAPGTGSRKNNVFSNDHGLGNTKSNNNAIIGIGFIGVLIVIIGFSIIIYALIKYFKNKDSKMTNGKKKSTESEKQFSDLKDSEYNADKSEYNHRYVDSELQSMILID